MENLVRKTLADISITPERELELRRLSEAPDSEIDFSDIPELTEEFWANAIPNPYYMTVRLDADIAAWLRKQSKGHRTSINALLREIMLREVRDQKAS